MCWSKPVQAKLMRFGAKSVPGWIPSIRRLAAVSLVGFLACNAMRPANNNSDKASQSNVYPYSPYNINSEPVNAVKKVQKKVTSLQRIMEHEGVLEKPHPLQKFCVPNERHINKVQYVTYQGKTGTQLVLTPMSKEDDIDVGILNEIKNYSIKSEKEPVLYDRTRYGNCPDAIEMTNKVACDDIKRAIKLGKALIQTDKASVVFTDMYWTDPRSLNPKLEAAYIVMGLSLSALTITLDVDEPQLFGKAFKGIDDGVVSEDSHTIDHHPYFLHRLGEYLVKDKIKILDDDKLTSKNKIDVVKALKRKIGKGEVNVKVKLDRDNDIYVPFRNTDWTDADTLKSKLKETIQGGIRNKLNDTLSKAEEIILDYSERGDLELDFKWSPSKWSPRTIHKPSRQKFVVTEIWDLVHLNDALRKKKCFVQLDLSDARQKKHPNSARALRHFDEEWMQWSTLEQLKDKVLRSKRFKASEEEKKLSEPKSRSVWRQILGCISCGLF